MERKRSKKNESLNIERPSHLQAVNYHVQEENVMICRGCHALRSSKNDPKI